MEQSLIRCEATTLLTEITAVASSSLYFDPSLLALCWRGVGKVTFSAAVNLDTVLPHVTTQLCQAIVTIARQCVVEEDPLLEKRLKSGRFLCSLMLRLVAQFPASFDECNGELVDMLLCTHQAIHTVDNVTLHSKLESSFLLLVSELVSY